MKFNDLINSAVRLLIVFTGMLVISSCDPSTDPPPPPIFKALDISLYNSPPEVTPGQNVQIAGRINNDDGEAQRGIRIYFTLDPADIGIITPWAWTEPDSATGLYERVVFNGSQTGTALITGTAEMPSGNTVNDTVSILVRDPING